MRDAAAALNHLRKNGWQTEDYGELSGPNCLVGSLATTLEEKASFWRDETVCHDTMRTLASVIAEQFPERVTKRANIQDVLLEFNDHKSTTFPDIELVLEKAALLEDEQSHEERS